MMNKQMFLEAFKPKVRCVSTEQGDVYVRELTIGINNHVLFERQMYLIEEAKNQGLLTDDSDDETIDEVLKKMPDKYALARTAAAVICDEEGNLLFDLRNKEDLEMLNQMRQEVIFAISEDSKKNA